MARIVFVDDKIINIIKKEEGASGGAAVQALSWIRGLITLGHDVYVLTRYSPGVELKEEFKNIKLLPLYDNNKGIRWIRWIYYRIPYLFAVIKKVKPDFIYQGIPNWNSYVLGTISKLSGSKFILRISNDYFLDDRFFRKHSKMHRIFLLRGMKLAHTILCQNSYQFGMLKKMFPQKNVYKLTNPIYITNREKPISADKKHIAWLGLFQYQKNLPLLYEIATKLSHESFLIAGKESSSCDAETRSYLKKLEQLPNVQFTGFLYREKVLEFLSGAKYLLNTSHYEGFSNTFLEAMTVGTPIITSDKVNPDNIISEHKLGIVYSDAEDLAAQFQSITDSDYSNMSENVWQYVIREHDHLKLSKRMYEFISS